LAILIRSQLASSGDALSYGQAATISALTVTGAFAANGGATLGDASGDALTINSSAVSIPNGLNFDSNTLVIDATNNNVGIGTSSPVTKLDISATANPRIRFEDVGDFEWRMGIVDNSNFGFFSGGSVTERMRIDSNGNVGIGTSSPTKKLMVGTETEDGLRIGSSDANKRFDISYDTVNNIIKLGSVFSSGYGLTPLTFYTNQAERMRIDSSGNVGIGTSSPSTYGKFVVNGSGNADAGIFIGNSSLTGSAPTYKGTVRILDNPTSTTGHSGGLEFLTSTFGSGYGWKIAAIDSSGVPLTFATRQNSASWTEAMRIDINGNLLLTTTSPFGKLAVSGIAGTEGTCVSLREWGNGRGSAMNITAHNTANADVIYLNTSSTNVGKIAITSTATSYVTSSDYRLKENIAPMTGALAKVAQLKPCTYTWKSNGEASQGFIAHELAEVVPDCVTGEKDAVNEDGSIKAQGIDTSFLVATLTAAIQELKAEVDALKAQINQ